MSDRLTWDAHAPAPYESGWSVFLKVLSINRMTMRELERLIEQDSVPKNDNKSRNYLDGHWINFERYAGFLGVAAERLKEGFLDQLGVAPIETSWNDIRHCPQCHELGYHCVLFQLTIIEECPWHRCKLTTPCKRCGLFSTLNSFCSPHAKDDERFCVVCGRRLSHFINAPRFNALDDTSQYTIIGYCREYLDWFKKVKIDTLHCSFFTTELRRVHQEEEVPNLFAQRQLGFARGLAKEQLYWKFSVDAKPARLISRTYVVDNKTHNSKHYLADSVGHSYRSICRHIYTKHLRAHHACIKHLVSLSRDEALFLHSEKACLPAVAFLTWRMSVEGVCNIEELQSKEEKQIPLRLMSPHTQFSSLSINDQIRWTYDSFFGLLAALEAHHEQYWRMVITLASAKACDGFLQSQFTQGSNRSRIAKNGTFQMLRPEAVCLAEKKCAKWLALSQTPNQSMCDDYAYDSAMTWWWGNDHSQYAKSLFKLTQSERYGKQIFVHFNV